MGDERQTIDYDGDAAYDEKYQHPRYHDECDSEGHSEAASEGTSVSEIAGNRLYAQALETRRKIEKAREKRSVYEPQLDMATRGRTSRDPSPSLIPRYLQLYEHSKGRRTPEPEQEDVNMLRPPKAVVPNEGCNRLYALSASKQQEGKDRREEIIKSKMKPPPPFSHLRKISADEGSKIYDRGMKHLISLEMKRIEAAVESETPYRSPLVRVGVDEESRED